MAKAPSPIRVNRAPVLTLWAAVVAERLGHRPDTALSLAERALGGWVSFLPLRSAGDGRDCLDLGPRWLAFPVLGGPGQGTVADRAAPALPAADVVAAR